MLDTHRLRVFRAVVASGSIQAAARNLGYTPSAVSQHVSALQRDTGLTLFAKVGRGIEPTDAGRQLALLAEEFLHHQAELETKVEDLRSGYRSTLTMAYFASVGRAWMPHVAQAVGRQFPDLHLRLLLTEGPPSVTDPVDLQILQEAPGYVSPPGFVTRLLLDEPFVAILPVGHDLVGTGHVALADLGREPWIDADVPGSWCRTTVDSACAASGVVPKRTVETQDQLTAISFVAAGMGVTVVPRLWARDLPTGLTAVPLANPSPTRSLYAVVASHAAAHPAAQLALAVLRSRAHLENVPH